jgi:hypothetical protein
MTSQPHSSSLPAVSRVVQVATGQSIATTHHPIRPCPPSRRSNMLENLASNYCCSITKHVARNLSISRQNSWLGQSLKPFIGSCETTSGLKNPMSAHDSQGICTTNTLCGHRCYLHLIPCIIAMQLQKSDAYVRFLLFGSDTLKIASEHLLHVRCMSYASCQLAGFDCIGSFCGATVLIPDSKVLVASGRRVRSSPPANPTSGILTSVFPRLHAVASPGSATDDVVYSQQQLGHVSLHSPFASENTYFSGF